MTFTVQMVSPCGIRGDIYTGLTEQEAIDICEENNWHYIDESGFEWALDYVEDREYEEEDEDDDEYYGIYDNYGVLEFSVDELIEKKEGYDV